MADSSACMSQSTWQVPDGLTLGSMESPDPQRKHFGLQILNGDQEFVGSSPQVWEQKSGCPSVLPRSSPRAHDVCQGALAVRWRSKISGQPTPGTQQLSPVQGGRCGGLCHGAPGSQEWRAAPSSAPRLCSCRNRKGPRSLQRRWDWTSRSLLQSTTPSPPEGALMKTSYRKWKMSKGKAKGIGFV